MADRTYETHDNRSRPFRVRITTDAEGDAASATAGTPDTPSLTVYISELDSTTGDYDIINTFTPLTVFIGDNGGATDVHTSMRDPTSERIPGNSILLQLTKLEYLFIGDVVKSFTTKLPIVIFNSPIGRNDVPYPYAVDAGGKYYLMIENCVVDDIPPDCATEPYKYFWTRSLITVDMRYSSPRYPHIRDFYDIKTYIIGDQVYTLSWSCDAEATFNRSADEIQYIKTLYGVQHQINKEDYCNVITEFGYVAGLSCLDSRIIHPSPVA